MNAAVSLMDGLGLDGDRCIRVIPRRICMMDLIHCVLPGNQRALSDGKKH